MIMTTIPVKNRLKLIIPQPPKGGRILKHVPDVDVIKPNVMHKIPTLIHVHIVSKEIWIAHWKPYRKLVAK